MALGSSIFSFLLFFYFFSFAFCYIDIDYCNLKFPIFVSRLKTLTRVLMMAAMTMTLALQLLNRRKHHTLKNSVPTRWNSTYLMVSSVLDLLQEVNASLIKIGKYDLRLSAVEENLLNEIRSFLAPFESYTQLVSGNQPTLSLILLIRDAIAQHCSLNPRDHSIVKQLKGQVMANLDVRLPQDNDVLLATLLDPTTKTLPTQPLEEQVGVLKEAVHQTEAELAEHRNVDAAE